MTRGKVNKPALFLMYAIVVCIWLVAMACSNRTEASSKRHFYLVEILQDGRAYGTLWLTEHGTCVLLNIDGGILQLPLADCQ